MRRRRGRRHHAARRARRPDDRRIRARLRGEQPARHRPLRRAGTPGLWAAILATAIGPGLLLTGSVATVICRRIARDAGTALHSWQYTAAGSVLVPAQLAAAFIGLHLTGALR
jgi:Na+/H+ antiporter NhaD/arsenite permease-like protein